MRPISLRPSLASVTALIGFCALLASAPAPSHAQNAGALAQAGQQRETEKALQTPSGKSGTNEPTANVPTEDQSVLVNGALNVPAAPKDSQTVPAKYSARNAALDKLPIMAFPLALTDAQKRTISETLRKDNAPVADIDAKITEELPATVALRDLPAAITAAMPAVNKLKFVRLADRILLVDPPNRVVVGEINI